MTNIPVPKLAEASETPINVKDEALVVLQPKYDGCQAIFIPTDTGYVPITRKGQIITRLLDQCSKIPKGDAVLFTEYEPLPWSEENKAKLAGNLYTTKKLPFSTTLTCFDQVNKDDYAKGLMRTLPTKPRLELLDKIAPELKEAGISVSPWAEMPYAQAKALCKSSQIETENGTRCKILGVLTEGGIIRAGNLIEKNKPKIDVDAAVLYSVLSEKGQRGWVVVDTKKPNQDGLMVVFGGVNPSNHTAMLGKVVELAMLTVSATKGAGNPTFSRDRSNEKDFEINKFIQSNSAAIQDFLKAYKLKTLDTEIDL